MQMTKVRRPKLEDLRLSAGKQTRLYRLLYKYGPANGTLLLLPVDQGLEHGPRDFFANPDSIDPGFELRLALEGGYQASSSTSDSRRSTCETTPARCRWC